MERNENDDGDGEKVKMMVGNEEKENEYEDENDNVRWKNNDLFICAKFPEYIVLCSFMQYEL